MTENIQTRFRARKWEESPITDGESFPRLTRAVCEQIYSGDLEGNGLLEFVIAYGADGAASFVGFERVTGTLSGKRGCFVLRHEGAFESGVARATITILSGSGTEEFAGIEGRATFESAHAEEYALDLEVWYGSG